MSRARASNPKRPFACQLRESDLSWLRQLSLDQRLPLNVLVEIAINLLRVQFDPANVVNQARLAADYPPIISSISNDFKQLSDD